MGPITVSHVMVAVSRRFNVTPDLLRGPRRSRPVAQARQLAYLLSAELCPHLTISVIARMFGHRDHTTILYGVKKAQQLMRKQKRMKADFSAIKTELEGRA